jgi:hypothetical protein
MNRRHLQRLGAGIALAGMLAACGSTKATSSPVTTISGTTPTTQTPTGSPLLIGVTDVIGSTLGDYSDAVASARAAVLAINAAGGVGGHPLEIVYCDNGYDANKSAACAREFVAKGVVAMASSTAPFGESQMTAILDAAGIPAVGDNPLASWVTAANQFPVAQYLPGVYADVPACEMLGYPNISVGATSNAIAGTFNGILRGVATKLPDVKVISGANPVVVGATLTDVSPQVEQVLGQIKSNKGCVDLSGVYGQQEVLFLKGFKTFNADPSKIHAIWGVAGVDPKTLPQIAPLLKSYLIGIQMFPPLSEISKFKTLQQEVNEINAAKAAGGIKGLPTAQRDLDIQSWLGIHALATVMQQEKAYTAKDIMAAMLRVKDVNIGDLTPPWTPTAKGGTAFLRLPVYDYYVVEYNAQAQPVLALPNPIDIRKYLP